MKAGSAPRRHSLALSDCNIPVCSAECNDFRPPNGVANKAMDIMIYKTALPFTDDCIYGSRPTDDGDSGCDCKS